MIHVCSLERLNDTIADTGAQHLVTLLKDTSRVTRPAHIPANQHLILSVDDIAAVSEGYIHPCDTHVADLLAFVQSWERRTPIVIHCYAGISRSTAAAYVAACALNPQRSEEKIAQALRDASPTAQPNRLIVAIADRILARDGRMVRAVERIGTGDFAEAGRPFRIDLE